MRITAWVCAFAIFLGSCLLFLVEPMVAKRLLPLLGGSAAVWTTCLVFFQTTLLLGYLFAHGLVTHLQPRAQAITYLALLVAGLAVIGLNTRPALHASTAYPVLSVFWVLTTLIGLPFFLLSTAGPLLQAWYARGFHARGAAADVQKAVPPYRLFALSNLGSLIALVLYPSVIEPRASLHVQTVAWATGFALFVVLCAVVLLQGRNSDGSASEMDAAASLGDAAKAPKAFDRLLWLLLSACGSLLLCAVTSYLSQNVVAIPLLWILPLTMYLLSFVVVFQGKFYPRLIVLGLLAVSLLALAYAIYDVEGRFPIKVAVPFFCISLFVACVFCHGELYRLRPGPLHATSFYLTLAAGGALGAFFVGVLSPVIFRANYEFACGLVFAAVLALIVTLDLDLRWRAGWSIVVLLMVAVVISQAINYGRDAILQMRSFYGTLHVTETRNPPGAFLNRALYHGTIEHGNQIFADGYRTKPTTYYAHESGVGLALDLCCPGRPRRVAVIGLGSGTLAAYGRPGDVFRFYEIDPLVERIANNVFTYLKDSPATIQIAHGDARLSLVQEQPQNFDVIAVDAFSGDAVPVHLLTAEAIALYRRHLRPGGIMAFHVSSQYLDLGPLILEEARHAGLEAQMVTSEEDEAHDIYEADWVLVTDNKNFLALPQVDEATEEIKPKPRLRLWTDDYNSLLPLLK